MRKSDLLSSQGLLPDNRFRSLWLGLLLVILVISITEFAFLTSIRWFDLLILIVLIRAIAKPDTQALVGMVVMCLLYLASAATALYFSLSMHALVPGGIDSSTRTLLDDLLLPGPRNFFISLLLRIIFAICLCTIVYIWFRTPRRIADSGG